MSNFLNFQCPQCIGQDQIDIFTQVWARVTVTGYDPEATQ